MGASIADVARLSGVSVATVSRALRGLPNVSVDTRARVRAAADELDYVADPNAARLAGQRTSTLALVVPMLSSWYHGRLLEAVEQAAGTAALEVLPYVLTSEERVAAFVEQLPFRKRIDALLVSDIPLEPEAAARVVDGGVPVVTCGAGLPGASTVRIDDRAAAAGVTRHLLGLGHVDVGVIGGPGLGPDFTVPHDRVAGVVDALDEVGLRLRPEAVLPGNYRADDGARGMAALLATDRVPTAVVALSDEMAIGAIHTARAAGLRVPQDLSVVGFDDHDLARYADLTTVRQDIGRVGGGLVALALERVEDPSADPVHRVVPTSLVERGTTAPPPAPGGLAAGGPGATTTPTGGHPVGRTT